MDDKQKVSSNEGFWSELDESDEDFETMIGMGKKSSEDQEIKLQKDIQTYESEEDQLEEQITTTEEFVELNLPPFKNIEVVKSAESLESLKEATSFEILTKEKESLISTQSEFECGEIDSESFEETEKPSVSSNTVLSAEKMDFLWDDEDEEDVFIQSKPEVSKKEEDVFIQSKPEVSRKEEDVFIQSKTEVSRKEEDVFIQSKTEVSRKEEDVFIQSKPKVSKKEDEVIDFKRLVKKNIFAEEGISIKEETIHVEEKKNVKDVLKEGQEINNSIIQEVVKPPTQKNTPTFKILTPSGIQKSPKTNDSSLNQKKFDIQTQTPIALSINRFTVLYSTLKQKRRNQHGEYVDKETNVVSTYEYSLHPKLTPSITLQNILQLNDEYQDIIKILSLKECHVDNICSILKAKDVIYSRNKFSEEYDSSDVNNFIDLCLVDKNMAIDFACKKKMWSYALLISNNRPDIVKQFFSSTLDNNMVALALSVVDKGDSEDVMLDSDWKKYLKHILRIPFGNIHMKYIEKVRNSNAIDLCTLLVCFHVFKLVNIGDVTEYYSKNFYMLQIAMYLDKHFTPVNNIGILMYQYITVLYDFDKKASEEFYVENKKSFGPEIQASLDQVFHVGGWGFGFKDVINFGISKILNVEEEKKPVETSELSNKTIGPININRSKVTSSFANKTAPPIINGDVPESNKTTLLESKKSNPPSLKTVPVKKSFVQGFRMMPVRQNQPKPKDTQTSNETYGAIEDIEKAVESISLNEKEIEELNKNVMDDNSELKSKSLVINETKPLYSDQQHAKSFADIMDLEKPQKEYTTEDDTSLFLSKYNIDDNEAGLKKKKEENKDEEQKSSFFSMFNIFKKNVYKVDLQASDDIKYDPVTKKWVSGNTQSAPQEVKKVVPKSIPLPSKGKAVAKPSVDIKNMSMYANKKSIGKAVIPGVSSIKKPSDNEDKM